MKLSNKYYILRHGEAVSNLKQIVSSWPEEFKNPLTKRGIEMIEESAERLKDKNIDLIFASDLLRTRETAEIVAKALGIKPEIEKQLREIDFGIFNGKPIEEFKNYFKRHRRKLSQKVPEGESYLEVQRRVAAFFDEINKKYKGKTILIVSHQAPLLLLCGYIREHSIAESIEPLYNVFNEKKIKKGELIQIN